MKATPATTRYFKLLLAGLVLLTTFGCGPNVLSKLPVGETPIKIVAEDWKGNWINSLGNAVHISIVDADKGMLKISWIDDDSKGDPIIETAVVELRASGEWLFANYNTRGDKESELKRYVWGRITNKDRQIVIWQPDDDVFKQLVKDGVFPGKIEPPGLFNLPGDVILDELKPEHLKIITSGERGVLFKWDEPFVIFRVGEEPKKTK